MSEEKIHRDEDDFFAKLEGFYRKYKVWILSGVIGIVVVVGGYLGYVYLYEKPRMQEAQETFYKPLLYFFEQDSFNLAITGTQGTMNDVQGLLAVQDEYDGTPAGDLALYALGVSYLNIGDAKQAAVALEEADFMDEDEIILGTMRLGAMGDALVETGDLSGGMAKYEEAINRNPNPFTTPLYLKKAGMLAERMGNYSKALEYYERIQKDYPQSEQGRFIEKYVARAKHNL